MNVQNGDRLLGCINPPAPKTDFGPSPKAPIFECLCFNQMRQAY